MSIKTLTKHLFLLISSSLKIPISDPGFIGHNYDISCWYPFYGQDSQPLQDIVILKLDVKVRMLS